MSIYLLISVTTCPPAPYPTRESNLETDYKEGDPVDFGDNVTYNCRSAAVGFFSVCILPTFWSHILFTVL